MKKVEIERVVPCDVDDTLIMHENEIPDPADRVLVKDSLSGEVVIVRINRNMVRLLKEEKQRGSFVIVWSRGGYQWAADVIRALNLEDHVDIVMSKPLVYFDDSPVDVWLKDRVYMTPDKPYKKHAF